MNHSEGQTGAREHGLRRGGFVACRCYGNERATAAVHGAEADKSIRAISGDPVSTGLVNSPDSTQRGVLVFTQEEPEQRFASRTLPINDSRPRPCYFFGTSLETSFSSSARRLFSSFTSSVSSPPFFRRPPGLLVSADGRASSRPS